MPISIPFNKPFIAGKELYYIAQAVAFGNLSGDGQFTRQCSTLLEERFGIHRVLITPSCTSALEMAGMLCNLGPGDEVIMPSFTFVSTANAVVRLGARAIASHCSGFAATSIFRRQKLCVVQLAFSDLRRKMAGLGQRVYACLAAAMIAIFADTSPRASVRSKEKPSMAMQALALAVKV